MKWRRTPPNPDAPSADQLLPPEGVPIHLRIAGIGVRFAAQITDILITLLAAAAVLILLVSMNMTSAQTWFAIAYMFFFIIRVPYYVLTEIAWNGQTLGKRLMKIKVVSYDGRTLTIHALVVRNLMKEAEIFLPGTLILTLDASDPAYTIPALIWIIGTCLVPLFNKKRRRLGDLIAGTYVIHLPQPVLLPDVAKLKTSRATTKPEFTFLSHQLNHYGAYELQTLEDLLRAQSSDMPYQTAKTYAETLAQIVDNIRRKIDYPDRVSSDQQLRFLQAFYNAQRAHLEQRQLFGERRSDKFFDQEETKETS